ncbi:stage II sporulation protein R [Anaerocolumna xylanovorans]|uniref:stage II sporulation protein R n=1 Tax=Anaerocolumna xylanovorans TaxID=100134 RepID=UPI001FA8C6A9|nr:stage II sporulation protein R [Anaerocolumna xylanovorans]
MKNLHSHILLYLHRKNSINLIASLSLCLICILLSFKAFSSSGQSAEAMQKDIASEIIRFHVIANSDSTDDQALKLKVKSALTQNLYPVLSGTKDIDAARHIIEKQLPKIEELAEEVIENNGYHYTVKASLEKGYFPIKVYGDLTLPPGQYEALRIEIGKAQGQNWWCVMFPPLCFVDATYSVVPKDSKNQLKHVLTEEEYNSVFSCKKADIKIKFKLFDVIKDCFSKES